MQYHYSTYVARHPLATARTTAAVASGGCSMVVARIPATGVPRHAHVTLFHALLAHGFLLKGSHVMPTSPYFTPC